MVPPLSQVLPLLAQLATATVPLSSQHAAPLACAGWRFLSAQPQPQVASTTPSRAQLAGQPTHMTHPELLGPEELAPGISSLEFEQRRQALARLLPPNSLAVLPAASTAYVTGVIPYPYRQDADFMYLTGVAQPGVALIETSSSDDLRFTLFTQPEDRERERWDGAWLGAEAAREVFRADRVYLSHELPSRLQQLASSAQHVLFDFDRLSGFQFAAIRGALGDAVGRGRSQPLRPFMHRLRWRKSGAELDLMRASAAAAADALVRCIAISHSGIHEAALAATFEYGCRLSGAQRMAYPPVVGGGPDACTIHYSRNDKPVAAGQLVLMDAGCELHGYASDVTRTWPVSGRFTSPQRAVYDIVLSTRAAVLAAARPGTTLARLHALSVRLLSEGLSDLGVLPGMSADTIASGVYREFYCHSVGHYLGLDVHDTNTIGPQRTLEPGVVLALEPGLYIPDDPARYGAFAGIGVRLEDDVLITHEGSQVLSACAPVEAADVEELVGSALARQQQQQRQAPPAA